jgi:hypothetical protein
MKKIVILSSYADNELKEKTLIDSINSFKLTGYDVLLVSHLPINSDIQKLVNFYIYDDNNTLLPSDFTPHTWFEVYDLYFRINKKGHVLPICRNISNSINYIISQNYDFFIFSESDNVLSEEDVNKLKSLVNTSIIDDKKMIFFKPSGFLEHGSPVYETLMFGGCPDYFLSKFKVPTTIDEWSVSSMNLTFEMTFYDKFKEYENDILIIDSHSSEYFNLSKINIFRYDTFVFDFIYNEINPNEAVLIIHNLINNDNEQKIIIRTNDDIIYESLIPGGYWEYRTYKFNGDKFNLEYYINNTLQYNKEYILNDLIIGKLKENGFLKKKELSNNKLTNFETVDVICLANTKDEKYFRMTEYALKTLHVSENKYKFNVHLVESNYESNYDYSSLTSNYIKPNESFNYNKFLNICNKYINSDWVVIINNDVFFEKNWFSNIVTEHNKNPEIKSFSPKDPVWYNHWYPGHIFDYEHNTYEGYTISEMVFGWCLVIKKEVWDYIYPWDESFNLYYQDNDYVERIKLKDIKHAMINTSIVHHLGSMTVDVAFGEKEDDSIKNSGLTFVNKWNKL